MTDVITGLGPAWESIVATALESATGVTVIRRCADVAELLSVAEAGLGQCAVISADLRGLDLSLVRTLTDHGIALLGLYPSEDEAAERRLRQLGISAVLPVDADASLLGEVVRREGERRAPGAAGAGPAGATAPGTAGRDALRRPEDLRAPSADPGGVLVGSRGRGGPDATHQPAAGWRPQGAPPSPEDEAETRSSVIAVWGPTGAPGRTTIAVNVAAELATRGHEVLLVDADTYGGCVSQALGLLDEAPGIAAVCRAAEHGALDLSALARLAPFVAPGLRVLTGLPKAERWPEVRAAALERVLDLSRSLASLVVIDCGFCIEDDEELSYDTAAPRRNESTLTALGAADAVLAVGGADPVALQRFVRALQDLGTVPSPTPLPVVNRVRASAVGAGPQQRIADSLLRFAGLEGIRFVPNAPDVVDAALLAGRSVVEHAPDSALRGAFAELASAVAPWTDRRVARSRPVWRRRQGAKRMVSPAKV